MIHICRILFSCRCVANWLLKTPNVRLDGTTGQTGPLTRWPHWSDRPFNSMAPLVNFRHQGASYTAATEGTHLNSSFANFETLNLSISHLFFLLLDCCTQLLGHLSWVYFRIAAAEVGIFIHLTRHEVGTLPGRLWFRPE